LCSVVEKKREKERRRKEKYLKEKEKGKREERFREKLQTRIHSLGKAREMAIPRHINFKLCLEPPAAPTNEYQNHF